MKRLNDHIGDSELDPPFDDGEESHREAQKTACTILNMTPEELSGFMKGRPANKVIGLFRKYTSFRMKVLPNENVHHSLSR